MPKRTTSWPSSRDIDAKPTAAMCRLLAAQDVAGPADLEVREGDLEAGPELRGIEDRLEALAGVLAHPLAPAVEQICVRTARGAAHPTAELVELGQAKCV